MDAILRTIKKLIPTRLFKAVIPAYHWFLTFLAALIYRFPSHKIFVVGLVGTKGKTTTAEIISAIFEEAGYQTAVSSSLRFKIGKESEENKLKMTMPGRFFMQKFLRKAVKAKCQYAIIEMTSQGAIQYRHKFIKMNALIFTNISPEHIEAHGSFENYREAKLSLFKALEKSGEKHKIIIANEDDSEATHFLNFKVEEKIKFGLKELESYNLDKDNIDFVMDGEKIHSKLSGKFNLYNILGAVAFAKSQNIGIQTIKSALAKFSGVGGRVEFITLDSAGEGTDISNSVDKTANPNSTSGTGKQDFRVIVDYAHTADSLEKLYEVFQDSKKICVLGSCGGGRDKWKRPEMGKVASKHCDKIILTNEDPYDEDPKAIVNDVASGIGDGGYEIIMGRKEAIAKAIQSAETGDTVLITGKGCEPWIMGPKGTKIAWDDREAAREELKKRAERRK